MTPVAIDQAARVLAEAREGPPRLAGLPADCAPTTLADAQAIQDRAVQRLDDAVAGWKVGTSPEGVLCRGALLRSRMLASGSGIRAALVPLLGIEVEIAFRFKRALPARAEEYRYEEVAAAVTALPAIEIVDSRFAGYPKSPFLDRVADFMSNGAFVAGEPQPRWREFDLTAIEAELAIDGRSTVRRAGGHPTKDPLLPAVALANALRAGTGIGKDQIVTTGTYTGLHFAQPGQSISGRFAGFGAVDVRLES
jgi:2-keto-4-pentenoate hydratase